MSTTTAQQTDRRPAVDLDATNERPMNPVEDVCHYVEEYARRYPDRAAMWCFGLGFLVGWKLKPW